MGLNIVDINLFYSTFTNIVFIFVTFYAPQRYRQVLLREHISYGNSVCLSVCPSVRLSVWGVTTRYRIKPM